MAFPLSRASLAERRCGWRSEGIILASGGRTRAGTSPAPAAAV
jgi:hypothetical protein